VAASCLFFILFDVSRTMARSTPLGLRLLPLLAFAFAGCASTERSTPGEAGLGGLPSLRDLPGGASNSKPPPDAGSPAPSPRDAFYAQRLSYPTDQSLEGVRSLLTTEGLDPKRLALWGRNGIFLGKIAAPQRGFLRSMLPNPKAVSTRLHVMAGYDVPIHARRGSRQKLEGVFRGPGERSRRFELPPGRPQFVIQRVRSADYVPREEESQGADVDANQAAEEEHGARRPARNEDLTGPHVEQKADRAEPGGSDRGQGPRLGNGPGAEEAGPDEGEAGGGSNEAGMIEAALASRDEPLRLRITAHHHVPSASFKPRLPIEKALEGIELRPLQLTVTLEPGQMLVIGRMAPPRRPKRASTEPGEKAVAGDATDRPLRRDPKPEAVESSVASDAADAPGAKKEGATNRSRQPGTSTPSDSVAVDRRPNASADPESSDSDDSRPAPDARATKLSRESGFDHESTPDGPRRIDPDELPPFRSPRGRPAPRVGDLILLEPDPQLGKPHHSLLLIWPAR